MKNTGISFLSFLFGAIFGAIIALLYAPTSGEELRTQIRDEADIRLRQASEEWDRSLKALQKSMEETSTEIKDYIDQLSVKRTEEIEETAAVEAEE